MQLDERQIKVYKGLSTPEKIQDFLDTIPINFELEGETYLSPLEVLKQNRAHCLEGALLAASILRFHGHKPLVMDLKSTHDDVDHVVALFQVGKYYGSISKTNHAVLRYREPVYRNLRELALSFFHEYFDNKTGNKNLRSYSAAFDLQKMDYLNWETTDKNLQELVNKLDWSRHYPLVTKKQISHFRKADPIEIKAGELLEWSEKGERIV